MADLTDAEIDAALERGRTARLHEPRAVSARYDRTAGRVIVELTNGCIFAFPPALAQELEGATADQLATVEVQGSGSGLRWETLDADISVRGLMTGLFGTATHMAQQAGRAISPANPDAARANGAKGGRPRKSA